MAEPARATAAVDQPMAKGSAWREGDGGGDVYNDEASYASSEEDFEEENMVMPMHIAYSPSFSMSCRIFAGVSCAVIFHLI